LNKIWAIGNLVKVGASKPAMRVFLHLQAA